MVDRAAARNTSPEFAGQGDSRGLITQGGRELALLQNAMSQEGGMYTIAFSVQPPTDAEDNAVPFQTQARIRYSEGGNTIQRRITVINGTSMTLPGRVIDLRIFDATPATLPISGGDTPGAGSKYRVSVIVERGTRPSETYPPTLYGGIFQLAEHASEALSIPDDAGVISVCVSAVEATAFPTVKPNIVVSFQSGAGIWKQIDPSVNPGFVTIPPGATEIVVTNADGTNAANVTVEWGVDG